MLGGSHTGYERLTRRWWTPVSAELAHEGLTERPLYFVSSNTHSLVNIVTGIAREREPELVSFVEQLPEDDILREELAAFREGHSQGSWDNFLYFVARMYFRARGAEGWDERRHAEQADGVTHLSSKTALRVPAQVISLAALKPSALDPRVGEVDAAALARSGAVIVNIDYPLGVAAYNILREIAVDRAGLRGVYILGKAATLNADVGDVMISSVVHDEHSGSTYWLDNAFSVDDLAADLRFGTGLDNQRAVSVKGTFLQNRGYLDFYYREAFTVVEMEAGPYCNAVYEIAGRRSPPGRRGGELLKAPDRPRDHPLRVRHPLHAGPNARRSGPQLLRAGFDLRVVAGDPQADPAPRGSARARRRARHDPALRDDYAPTGCQAVLSSVTASIRSSASSTAAA